MAIDFSITSGASKVSSILEMPYLNPVDIAYYIKKDDEIIGSSTFLTMDVLEIEGLVLENGDYQLIILEKNSNAVFAKYSLCIEYEVVMILESVNTFPISNGILERPEVCNLSKFPENFNIPGFIFVDSGYGFSNHFEYGVFGGSHKTTIAIKQETMLFFQFFLEEVEFDLKINLVDAKGKELYIENEDYLFSDKLVPGNYTLVLSLDGIKRYAARLNRHCERIGFYINFAAVGLLKKNISQLEHNCSKVIHKRISPNTQEYDKLVKIESDNEDDLFIIYLEKSIESGEFIAEINFNSLFYAFPHVFTVTAFDESSVEEILNGNKQIIDELYLEEPRIIRHENQVWITVKTQANRSEIIIIKSNKIWHEEYCATLSFNYTYNAMPDLEKSRHVVCDNNNLLPKMLHYKFEGEFEKGQRTHMGNFSMSETFLVPKEGIIKTKFYVNIDSLLIIKIKPEKANYSAVVDVYSKENSFMSSSHSDFSRILIYKIPKQLEPHVLKIAFAANNELSACDTYQLDLQITNEQEWINSSKDCEDLEEFKDNYVIDKSTSFMIETAFSSKMKKEKSIAGVEYTDISIEIKDNYQFTSGVRYYTSRLSIALELLDEKKELYSYKNDTKSEIFENEIVTDKVLKASLKPGKYIFRIIYKKHIFETLALLFDDLQKFCLDFNVSFEFTKLESDAINIEDDYSLANKPVSSNSNYVISVSPSGLRNLKLIKSVLSLEVEFIGKLTKNADLIKMVFLKENVNQTIVRPSAAEIIKQTTAQFTFVGSSLEKKKCYTLNFDFSNMNDGKTYQHDYINHIYCTNTCDCNELSDYKCTKSGKCKCSYPYKGERCDQCEEGYLLKEGRCIEKVTCDPKVHCSNHGQCFAVGDHFICNCENGFGSYGRAFCNKCSNNTKIFPHCQEDDNFYKFGAIGEANYYCNEGSHKLPSNLNDESDDLLKEMGGPQQINGSILFEGLFKASSRVEETYFNIKEKSIIKLMNHNISFNRAKVEILTDEQSKKVAYLDGLAEYELFIAELEPKSTPYVLRVTNENYEFGCHLYMLKFSILPTHEVLGKLFCDVETAESIQFLKPNLSRQIKLPFLWKISTQTQATLLLLEIRHLNTTCELK